MSRVYLAHNRTRIRLKIQPIGRFVTVTFLQWVLGTESHRALSQG